MVTLRRRTRPTDRHQGMVYGESFRATLHTDGELTGWSTCTMSRPEAVRRMQADGWEPSPFPARLGGDRPVTLAEAVVRGTLEDIAAHLLPELPLQQVEEALLYEERCLARPEVLDLLASVVSSRQVPLFLAGPGE